MSTQDIVALPSSRDEGKAAPVRYEPLGIPRQILVVLYVIVAVWYLAWRPSTLNPQAMTFSIVLCQCGAGSRPMSTFLPVKEFSINAASRTSTGGSGFRASSAIAALSAASVPPRTNHNHEQGEGDMAKPLSGRNVTILPL